MVKNTIVYNEEYFILMDIRQSIQRYHLANIPFF